MLWSAFCGGSYTDRSPVMDSEAAVNLFVSTIQAPGSPKTSVLRGTPGLLPHLHAGSGGCRGSFTQDGRTLTVIGTELYELSVGVATLRGTIANDGLPVSFASNGRGGEQLAIVGGGELKIFTYTTNVLSAAIVLPLTYAPVQIAFLDGYFLLLEASTVRVWFSALEDGTSWDALDFFARSQTSDNLVGLVVLRDRIWTLGSQTVQLYYDTGDADNPFQPYPGSILLEGAVSPWAITVFQDRVIWLATDVQGRGKVLAASEGAPQRLSTPAIEYALAQLPTLADAEVLAYEQEGHAFVCFTFPSAGQTWCVDLREQLWHERASFDDLTGQFVRWRARGIVSTANGLIVGDYATGQLYYLDLDTFTDNGQTIKRLRRAPYLGAENQLVAIDQIELGAQVGVGLGSGQGSAPVVMARCSKDAGRTWGPIVLAPLGAMGQYLNRVIWRRWGQTRLDRFVFEVTVTDPVRIAFGPGLWLRVRPGSGTL